MSKLSLQKDNTDPVWYRQGLNFKCTECGKCCTGSPGHVWVTEEEIQKIADYLKIEIKQFCKEHVRVVNQKYSLIERPKTYDCVFLKDNKCQIYPVRPKQCRSFPWWISLLRSKEEWENAAKTCEGINKDAPLVSFETIQSWL